MDASKNALEVLADAISDVGRWTWWVAELPDIFQLEFQGAQLLFAEPTAERAASTLVALQFRNPVSISFLTDEATSSEQAQEWPQQLHNDEIDGFTCSYEYFTFNNLLLMRQIVAELGNIDTVFGAAPFSPEFEKSEVKICFRAGSVGLIIGAKEVKIISHEGEVALVEVEEKNRQWWEYWKRYWQVKNTDAAYPTDYACEVTIPIQE